MKIKLPVLIAFIIALGLASCKKGNDEVTVPLTTDLKVINATGDTINIYVNGTRINNLNSLYPLGASDYLEVTMGTQNYQFKKAGSPNVLFNLPLAVDTGKTYSLFVAGSSAENVILDADNLPKAVTGKAFVRFVHTSPGAGNLDVRVGEGDTTVYRARAYKTLSSYATITPGIKRVRIYKAGITTAVVDTTRTFSAGKAYTLFTKGAFKGTAGTTSVTGLITDN
jgi:hypothetical protein